MTERRLGNYLMLETLGQGGFSKSAAQQHTRRTEAKRAAEANSSKRGGEEHRGRSNPNAQCTPTRVLTRVCHCSPALVLSACSLSTAVPLLFADAESVSASTRRPVSESRSRS